MQNILEWPVFSWAYAGPGLAIIALILLGILISRVRFLRRHERDILWLNLARFATKRKLSPGEVGLLKRFYDTLSQEEQDHVLNSKRHLHSKLHDFLARHTRASARDRVQMMDKLFPEIDFHMEVKSINDVQLGELCSVEFDQFRLLGAVVKKAEGAMYISLPDWRPTRDYAGAVAQVYLFRQHIGGFLMHGLLQRAAPGGVVFEPGERIEFMGDRHLMARIQLPITLTAWSLETGAAVMRPAAVPPQAPSADGVATPSGDSSPAARTPSAAEPPPPLEPVQFVGEIDRVSDRALVFLSDRRGPSVDPLLRRHEVWEGEFTLPNGFSFRCLGKIVHAGAPDRYIFRYLNASEAARHVLWETIQTHNPEREQLV